MLMTRIHKNMHVAAAILVKAQSLSPEEIFETHPPEEPSKISPQAASTNGSVLSYFKTWKRRCGAQWDNLRPQATE